MYWEMLLEEVLEPHKPRYFTFANIGNKQVGSKTMIIDKSTEFRERHMFKLGDKYPKVHFSKREAECMMRLLQDMLVREVADELGLSVRTVEYYIVNMRKKLGCRTKSELLCKVANSDFIELIKESDLAYMVS